MIGNEVDIFETFTVQLIQEIISKEEDDMLIFMEEFDEFEANLGVQKLLRFLRHDFPDADGFVEANQGVQKLPRFLRHDFAAKEEDHMELFKVDSVDDHGATMTVEEEEEEEEEEVPLKLPDAADDKKPDDFLEHMLLALDENEKEHEMSLVEKIRKKLSGMMEVKRGLTVDSGAADHVIPIGWLPSILFAVVQSIGSKAGLHYVAANGQRIPNVGQQLVKFMTIDGTWMEIMFQLAAINKPLVSVSKLISEGYKLVFDNDNSYILHNKSKKIIRMRLE